MMNILITGAGGTIGTASNAYFSPDYRVIALNHRDLDITDRQAVWHIIRAEQPHVIINCAVLGVDKCEKEPALARQINLEGPRHLAEAAAQVNAEMLHFSSNYVFQGCHRERAYTIADVPLPINEYGRTKLAGELAVSEALPQSFIVRTSWVFGGRNDNFLSTVPGKLISGQPFSAITDVKASTTFVVDLVRRVEEILTHKRYGTYHVVNDGDCSYFEFASEAARILALPDTATAKLIEPVSEDAMNRQAKRPRYSSMRCLVSEELGLAPMRHWRQALFDYVSSNPRSTG